MSKAAEPIKKLMAECIDGAELADALGVCTETINRWGDKGQLPILKVGAHRVYHVPSVLKLIAGGGQLILDVRF